MLAIRLPIARADLPGLCDRVRAALAACDAAVIDCVVEGDGLDATCVDALARLQLAARRSGCRIRLCDASPELAALVAFMGLEDVLTPGGAGGARTAGTASRCRGRT